MKKFLLFSVIFIFLASLGWGQTYTWNGFNDDIWDNTANWDGGLYPENGDPSYTIIIQSSSNDPVFSGTGLECDSLTIQASASLDMGAFNLNVNTLNNDGILKMAGDLTVDVSFVNNGNLLLTGSGSQNVTITTTPFTVNGTVTYDDVNGVDFAGLTNFNNLVINNGDRTVAENITVSGNFSLLNGSLETETVYVTGTSSIAVDITTTGDQTYNGNVTLGGAGIRTLTSTGGGITVAGTVTGTGVTINSYHGISLANAANALSGNITLDNTQSGTPTGDITFYNSSTTINLSAENNTASGNIIINKTGNLTIDLLKTSTTGSISVTASTGAVTQTGVIETGSLTVNTGTGITLDSAANKVSSVELTSATGNIDFTNKNAGKLIVKARANNGDVTITEATGGLEVNGINASGDVSLIADGNVTQTAEIEAVNLTVETNAGITLGEDNVVNNVSLKSTALSPAQGNITYKNDVGTANTLDITITAPGNVTITETTGGLDIDDINTTGKVTLSAGGNITVSGDITAQQLIAIADGTGIVTVNTVNIDSSNTGNEDLNAAIYIKAYNFVVTAAPSPPYSIIPGGPGGQLCLDLKQNWNDDNNVVDGAENVRWHRHFIDLSSTNLVYGELPPGFSITPYVHIQANSVITTFTLGSGYSVYINDAVNTNTSGISFETSGAGVIEFSGTNKFEKITLESDSGIKLVNTNITITGGFVLSHTEGITLETNSIPGTAINSINAANITLNGITTTSKENLKLTTTSGDIEIKGAVGAVGNYIGDITIAANTGKVTLYGAVYAESINITSTSTTIAANITTNGAQTYTGAVILNNNVNFTAGSGSTVQFNSTVNGITSERELVITNADVVFNGMVGSLPATLIKSVEINGNATINADITTTGDQTYSGTVTLGGTGKRTLTGSIGTIDASVLNGTDITINAGVDINLPDITGSSVTLNAGYPEHNIFDTPGTVTLGGINITDITIWCQTVISSVGTKNITGNIELYTDDNTVTGAGATFLNSCIISGTKKNELRPSNIEFGPAQTKPTKYKWINSNDENKWVNPIETTGHAHIYITGNISIPALASSGDLIFNTEFGNIVFESTYDASGYSLNLKTGGGNIVQTSTSIITVDNLSITAGNEITLAQDNVINNLSVISAAGNIIFINNKDLEISGINAGANDVNLTVKNGSINLSGNITASSITIDTGSINGNGIAAASTGNISITNSLAGINNDISLENFNAVNGNIIVSTNVKDIVYYSTGKPANMSSGGTWTDTLFVKANSAYNRNVELITKGTSNNIYLVDVIDSSQKTMKADSSAGIGANGYIEFFTTGTNAYLYSGSNINHLNLLPGAGGIRIVSAVVDITGDFKINNTNKKLTLDGADGSGIKAVNITLDEIYASDKIILEAGGNITIGGNTTAYQLIAKAPNGTVSINAVMIDSSNNGNEGENAAIYVVADKFVVTAAPSPPYSIIPGGTGGQLCLELKNKWEDTYFVIDGCEDGDPLNTGLVVRWHQHVTIIIEGKILYSFTEDSSGNGRLDRIRVQTNVELYGDFHDFDVSVEEYEVDRTKGVNGFVKASDVTLKTPFDDDSFYIYLKEKPEINGEKTPLWSITKNTSLTNKAGSTVGNPAVDINIKPIDTIPPRIVYTLTLPGYPQTYMQVSEPVVSFSGADISASFGGLSIQGINQVEPAGLGYIFNLSGSLRIEDLVKNIDSPTLENGYFQTDAVDYGQKAKDLSEIDPDSKPPKYPLDWSYTKYVRVSYNGNVEDETGPIIMPLTDILMPPNKLLTSGMTSKPRRVTDVLISMAPASTNSDNYFAWPVWARFKKSLNAPYTSVNDVFWGQQPTDTGIIWQFDGTNFLDTNFIDSNEGLELQARMNDNLPGTPVLFWTTSNIPAEYRNPKQVTEAKKTGGLWLPNVFSPLYNYVPLSDGINGKTADSSSSKLFNYNLAANSFNVESSAKFEFIFHLSNTSDLFIARLDIPRGVAIPADWYTLIRPFVFDIQNIRRQRGGVTVLNNVINSNNKETAFIRYHLTRPGRVTVQIYTLDGTLVKSLRRNEQRDVGEWTDSWDGTNNGGRAVARGMYFVRVVGPDIDEIRKIMVVK
jgi:hypothetical protein